MASVAVVFDFVQGRIRYKSVKTYRNNIRSVKNYTRTYIYNVVSGALQ
jgi:hypothetical protein